MKIVFIPKPQKGYVLGEESTNNTINTFIKNNNIVDLKIQQTEDGTYFIGKTCEDLIVKGEIYEVL
ncbi:MAG: hypothetical protein ACRC7W_01680 [Fusobacteriaceae bacterium]